jgi:hypothetical protein
MWTFIEVRRQDPAVYCKVSFLTGFAPDDVDQDRASTPNVKTGERVLAQELAVT